MQRQQLFNSLSLSLIAAILATQPAGANTVKVTAVRLNPTVNGIEVILETPKGTSPPVFTSSYDKTFVADIINTQLPLPEGKTFRQDNPADGIAAITVTPLNANSIRVTVTGKVGVPIARVVGKDRGVVISLTPTSETSVTQLSSLPPVRGKLGDDVTSNTTTPTSDTPVTQPSSLPPVRGKLGDDVTSNATTPTSDTPVTQLSSPPPVRGKLADDAPSNATTATSDTPVTQLSSPPPVRGKLGDDAPSNATTATSDTPVTQPSSPPPVRGKLGDNSTISRQELSDVVQSAKTERTNIRDLENEPASAATPNSRPRLPINPSPANSTNGGKTPVPEFLNPSANPLQFPTRPEQVQIRTVQPITLQQAFELARRNNRTLQISELNLEVSQAQLRVARAALYPTLSSSASIIRSQSGSTIVNTGSSTTNSATGVSTASSGTGTVTTTTGGTTTTISGTGNATTATGTTGTTTSNPTTTTTNNGGTTTASSGTGTTATNNGTTGTTTTNNGTTGATTTNNGTAGTTTTNNGTTGTTRVRNPATTIADASLTLSYDLFTGGRRTANIRLSEEQVRNSELALESALEQLRLDVAGDYYSLQQADETVRIDQAAVANATASLRDAVAQEQAGLGTRFDTLRAQVTLANDQQSLTNALSQQLISRRQLAQRLSTAQTVDLVAADPVEVAGLWKLSLEESIVQAYQNRAELQQYLAQRNIATQQRIIDLASLKPQVNLAASYSLESNDITSIGNIGPFNSGYSLQANVSLLLFDAGAARARAAQDQANIAIAETNFADQRNQIRFAVEQAFFNLQSNSANIQTARLALEQARESLRLARLRFQAGVGTQTDVISAENDLTNAEGNLVSAILNYNRSLVSLERAVSTGLPRR